MPLAAAAVGLFVVVLLVAALLGPGGPAAGAPVTSSTPAPRWLGQLAADYADACGATLDPSEIDGLSQPAAEARVSQLIDQCTASSAGASGAGKGKGNGKGNGKP